MEKPTLSLLRDTVLVAAVLLFQLLTQLCDQGNLNLHLFYHFPCVLHRRQFQIYARITVGNAVKFSRMSKLTYN